MPHSPRQEPSALSQALPIMLGYLPVGFAYGVLAVKAGLSLANTGLMSIIVFAGSAQLIGVDMIGAGAPAVSVIVTTFIVNLRHVLFSAALSPELRGWPGARIARFCFQLTDETFALHATRFHNQQRSPAKTLAINALAQSAWVAGSLLGAVAGGFVPDVAPLGLDFALPAMFAVLLVGQLRSKAHVLAGVLGCGLALILARTQAAPFATMGAAMAAALIACLTPWAKDRPGGPDTTGPVASAREAGTGQGPITTGGSPRDASTGQDIEIPDASRRLAQAGPDTEETP